MRPGDRLCKISDDLIDTIRSYLLVVIEVDLENRRKIAVSKTFDLLDSKLPILRRCANVNVQSLAKVLGDLLRPVEHAGQRTADLELIPADGSS